MWRPSAFVSDAVSAAMCRIFVKFGVEVLYKMPLSMHEFVKDGYDHYT
jgi:hypothetical protein